MFSAPLSALATVGGGETAQAPRKNRETLDSQENYVKIEIDALWIDMYIILVYRKEGKYMAQTAMTHARLTPEIKREVESILKELGISIS